jgi:hypothetical protein
MICYPTADAAEAILSSGFRDASGSYMCIGHEFTGVFLADQVMGINEGAKGDQVLRVEFNDDTDLGDFEWIEEEKPYREWCVPAALINEHAAVTLMSDDEVEELEDARFTAIAECPDFRPPRPVLTASPSPRLPERRLTERNTRW